KNFSFILTAVKLCYFQQKSLTMALGNTTARLKLKNNVGYSHSEHFSITLLVSRPKKLSMKKTFY
ncbi:hypothetical protein ACT726_04025, partial [Ornithobacterium rhinotracheale]